MRNIIVAKNVIDIVNNKGNGLILTKKLKLYDYIESDDEQIVITNNYKLKLVSDNVITIGGSENCAFYIKSDLNLYVKFNKANNEFRNILDKVAFASIDINDQKTIYVLDLNNVIWKIFYDGNDVIKNKVIVPNFDVKNVYGIQTMAELSLYILSEEGNYYKYNSNTKKFIEKYGDVKFFKLIITPGYGIEHGITESYDLVEFEEEKINIIWDKGVIDCYIKSDRKIHYVIELDEDAMNDLMI